MVALKLKYHAAEAGGVRLRVVVLVVALKLKYHAAEGGGVPVAGGCACCSFKVEVERG